MNVDLVVTGKCCMSPIIGKNCLTPERNAQQCKPHYDDATLFSSACQKQQGYMSIFL